MVPDTQVKEGVPTNHLSALGNYAAHKQPDVIVIIGDWWDLPSLSAWDSSATKVAEKRFYLKAGSSRGDVEAGNDAMADFLKRVHKKRSYRPEIHFLFGNHEDRITRRLRESPELGEAISLDHLKTPGVKRHPYLHPICIDGVWYCHFFCMDSNGRVMNSKRGQSSAKAQVKNFGESCVAGHRQGLDVAIWESQREGNGA